MKAYTKGLDEVLELVSRNNYVFSCASHNWSTPMGDSGLKYIRRLIAQARDLGVAIMTHGEYYNRCLALKSG